MIHRNKNYSNQDPDCQNGDHFIDCNLSQLMPNTNICTGKTGLRFSNCYMQNAIVPGDSQLFDCNNIQRDKCYWIRLVDGQNLDGLPVEPENCRHVIDSDEVTVDGVVVSRTYTREEIVL